MSAAAIEENSFRKDGDSFIPRSFAQEKLKTASSRYFELKTNYEMHISRLQQSHDSHCLKTKLFYEEYIKDMKFKAKSHISSQMILHNDLVSDLELKLMNSEKDVERLRDQLSSSRLNYQKESRSLKCLLSSAKENERLLEDQRFHNCVRYECEGVMAGMISITELEAAFMKEELNMLLITDRLSSIIPPRSRGVDVDVTEVIRSQRSLQTASSQQNLYLNTLAMIDSLGVEIDRIDGENAAAKGIVLKCIELERAIDKQYTKLSGLVLPSTDIRPDWEDTLSSKFMGGAAFAQEVLERGMRGLKRLCSKQDEESNKFSFTSARQLESILMLEVDACMQVLLAKVEIQSAPAMPVPLSRCTSSSAGRGDGHGDGDGDGEVPRCAWCSNRTESDLMSESQSHGAAAIPSSAVANIRGDIEGLNAGNAGESSREFDAVKASSSFKEDPAEEEEESSTDLTEQPCRDSPGRNVDVLLIVADRAASGIERLSALDGTRDATLGAPADSNREVESVKVKETESEEEKSPVTAVIVCHGEYASEVDHLEDVVYELQKDLSAASKRLEEGEQERLALSETLSAVMKEKRTDVIGEYVAEIQALKEQEERLRESLVTLRASKSKYELYVIPSNMTLNTPSHDNILSHPMQSYLTATYHILCRTISIYALPSQFMPYHLNLCLTISIYAVPTQFMPYHLNLCRTISIYALPSQFMPYHLNLCRTISIYAVPSQFMPYHLNLCRTISIYAVPSQFIPSHSVPSHFGIPQVTSRDENAC
jgi:hypothetical protein